PTNVAGLDWAAIKHKQSYSERRSAPSRPVRRNSSRRASLAGCLASYSIRSVSMLRKDAFKDSAIRLRTIRLAGISSAVHPRTSLSAARLNNRIRYEATKAREHLLARSLDPTSPAPIAHAQCDLPRPISHPH